MLKQRVTSFILKNCLSSLKKASSLNVYLPILVICSVSFVGCAGAPQKSQILLASSYDNKSEDVLSNKDSVILSGIPSMKSGESGTAGDVIFLVGDTYSSAGGLTCKSITISETLSANDADGRVVCDNGAGWFFIEDVFKVDGSDMSNKVMEIEMVNTAIGSLK